ncbi:MAG: GTP pyrophosphokinase family protein [Kofleriaceae bacterium]
MKGAESFAKKLKKKRYQDVAEMTDVVGVRVILPLRSEVGKVKSIIRSVFEIDEQRSVDKSAQLGTNKMGYRSTHIIARLGESRTELPEYKQLTDYFEIQVRTLIEHAWAQIEHDLGYKSTATISDGHKRGFALVAGLLEMADAKLDELASSIRAIALSHGQQALSDEESPSQPSRPTTDLGEQPLTVPLIDALLVQALGDAYKERSSQLKKSGTILRELENFGVLTVGELVRLFPDDFDPFVRSENAHRTTFVGTLRDMMLIRDAERYFTHAWEKQWDDVDEQEILRLGSLGADKDVLRHYLQPIGRDKATVQGLVDWFIDTYEDATEAVPYDEETDEFNYYSGGPYDPIEELDDAFNDRSKRMDTLIERAAERVLMTSTEWVKLGEYD